jgi:hypothetical protein
MAPPSSETGQHFAKLNILPTIPFLGIYPQMKTHVYANGLCTDVHRSIHNSKKVILTRKKKNPTVTAKTPTKLEATKYSGCE